MLTLRSWRHACALALLGLSTACATPGADLTADVGAIRTGVAAADAESERVFADINKAARDDVVDLLVLNGQPPTETVFASVVDADTAARWSAAFDGLDDYLAALQDLVDAKRSTAITGNLQAIGRILQGESFGARLPAGASGLFARLGGAIVQAAAEKKAQAIMRRTDPAFRALTTGLAALVVGASGQGSRGTLRNMVDNHWFGRIAAVENAYRTLRQSTADQRRTLLVRYGETLDRREADRRRLARLRQALLALGAAHAAAAEGSAGGTLFWLDQLDASLKTARAEAKAAEE